jgi:outer membrane protein assembly factor BamD (BamD/ComL family)
VTYERCLVIVLLALLTCAGGCSSTVVSTLSRIVSTPEQERLLAAGVENLRAGNEQKARDQLEKVIVEQPLPGVTDEALFRLALLSLRDEEVKGEAQANTLLDRLKREYPGSVWNRQAAPLAAYLRNNQREHKSMRNRTLSLTRDNKELRQSIERLKNLDLELEQRIKR